MGRQTATDVVAAGGSAVIIGQGPGRVDDTVKTLAMNGKAYGITAARSRGTRWPRAACTPSPGPTPTR
jgi:hypothetical protein